MLARRLVTALPRLLLVFLALALLPPLMGGGCADLVDEDGGEVSEEEIPLERRGVIPLRAGYQGGKRLSFWRLSTFVPQDNAWFPRYEKFPGMPVGELFVFAGADGAPTLASAQRPIIDVLPLAAGGSDFFEVVTVRAPASYRGNDIKSRATLLRAGYELRRTGLVVNCPVVGKATALEGAGSSGRSLTLWYRRKTTRCVLVSDTDLPTEKSAFKISVTPVSATRDELRVAASEVYALRTTAFTGADQRTNLPVPDNDVFRHAAGTPDYSPLCKIWDVTVPTDYVAGKIASYEALFPVPDFTDPRITARAPEAFCNCPLAPSEK
jgi:hypothetical protein